MAPMAYHISVLAHLTWPLSVQLRPSYSSMSTTTLPLVFAIPHSLYSYHSDSNKLNKLFLITFVINVSRLYFSKIALPYLVTFCTFQR